jgi:hypothetical protein
MRGHRSGHHEPAEETLALLALFRPTPPPSNAWVQGGNAFGAPGILGTLDGFDLTFITGGVPRATLDLAGNFVPPADNTGQVGTSALRWKLGRFVTVTTGDLEMKNEDGTAHWVLQEKPDGLYAVDKITGKTYKLSMQEVMTP